MIAIGVASPSAQGQAMISTETAATSAKAKRGSGPNVSQARKARTADGADQRHEPAADAVGEPLRRRAAALRLRDEIDHARQRRVAPDLLGPHDEAARAVDRAADQLRPGRLLDRHRLAGHHGFVDRARAVDHLAVDRDFFAGAHAQTVADRDLLERDLVVVAVGVDAQGALRREVEQRADRVAGLLPRRQLQHLPDDHQHA